MTHIPAWSGRRVTKATAWVINRDKGICWICGHPGADTLDHLIPRDTAPELTWDPRNWRAAHGAARPEYDCPGQFARGNYIGPRRPTSPTSREAGEGREWREATTPSKKFPAIAGVFGSADRPAGSPAPPRHISRPQETFRGWAASWQV